LCDRKRGFMIFDRTKLHAHVEGKRTGKIPLGWKIILIAVVIIAVLIALTTFITDFLWFKELGYLSVFLTKLFTCLKIGIPLFLVVSLLTFLYLKTMRKKYSRHIGQEEESSRLILWSARGLALLEGLIVTYYSVSRLWLSGLKFFNQTSFHFKDPLFGHDISFYVFSVDFLKTITLAVLIGVIILLLITMLYFFLLNRNNEIPYDPDAEDSAIRGNRFSQQEKEPADDAVYNAEEDDPFTRSFHDVERRSFSRQGVTGGNPNTQRYFSIAAGRTAVLGAVVFLSAAFYFFLRQYTILYRHTGAVYGAGWTDVHIRLWIYRIVAVLAVAGAGIVIYAVRKRKLKPIIYAPTAMLVVGIGGFILAMIVQNLVVSPDELSKESKYLKYNINYTQTAYKLNDVKTTSFPAEQNLDASDIQNNEDTIANIRINDYEPTMTFYNQTQAIRQYYDFAHINVDRYNVNGKYTQTYLSSREINENAISDTWMNRHLKYTHGYGITMSQVDRITDSGQPQMLVGSIPPESRAREISITQPEIYYGEMTNDYVLTGAKDDEFDYPDGDDNKYTRYEGAGGIKLTPFNRVMFSLREHSLKLLFSSNLSSRARIMVYRNVEERVKKIMPYLSYEEDPYMVTVNGKLYWIIDAYTTSNRYPYSEPYNNEATTVKGTNYVRNSVKVVVDAYNGTTSYYVVDKDDPLATTLQNIFPKLFKDIDAMPEALRQHIRYPDTMFEVQAKVYQRYHMSNVKVFYQNEDKWSIADEIYGTKKRQMTSNYYILNLPGEKKAEFVNSIPFTPSDKQNLSGLLMARNDGEHYGQLVLFKLPKSKVTYGPEQIESLIDQNTEISKEFSLWDSNGSKYTRGNMFVIPIDDSLLYVEPVYLEATNTSIPEVKRVIVAYGDKIAYEPTLAEALDAMFGEGAGEGYSGETSGNARKTSSTSASSAAKAGSSRAELIEDAQDAFDKAQEARKDGDWAEYGSYLDKMEKALEKLQ
jgi:uncharacterized membrane protein (UPF0182 family)